MRSPVFVVGCARSGTTLLYHMLVSSGDFVNYRSETHLYDMLVPRFAPFASDRNLRRFLDRWLASRSFRRTGLEPDEVRQRVLEACSSPGDLLRLVGTEMALRQGRPRWAECTPLHLLYMREIKRDLPDALFLHVIRDGRNVALSLRQLGWVQPLPWDRRSRLLAAAWLWEWQVERGRALGRTLGDAYMEVGFEDLVTRPRSSLDRIGRFVGSDIDYRTVKRNAVGSVGAPNTAFSVERDGAEGFDPLGRWRRACTAQEVRDLEATIGATLASLGYDTGEGEPGRLHHLQLELRKSIFRRYREGRQWLKDNSPLSRVFTRPYVDEV